MQRSVFGVGGFICLIACPILLAVLPTAVLDLLGVGVGLLGTALVLTALGWRR